MFYWVLKAILKPLLRSIYRIRVEGLENVPKKGPAIIAANHVSFLDSFFIPLVIRRRKMTYLAKVDYFKSWKTAWFFRSAGQIPCEREGGKRSEQSLHIALEVLAEGKLLGIYPEGTRSPDGSLHRGRTGVARLALQADAPVIPCGVIGTDKVMSKEAKLPTFLLWSRRFPYLHRPEVLVRYGKPLDLSRYAGKERDRDALREVTDEIMRAILELSGQSYVNEYASRTPALPLPEPWQSADDDSKLSEEPLAG
jgi:1-acyl-sn-glycerol-3-phosphate acyltransferase